MKDKAIKRLVKITIALGLISLIYKASGLGKKIKYIPNIPDDDSVIIIEGKGSRNNIEENSILDLIVWNSYKSKKEGFFEDLNKIINEKDLILLQEYYPNEKLLSNNKPNQDIETVSAISFYTKKEVPTGVCTISKIENSGVNFLRSEFREPVLKTPKMALITEYNINQDKKLYVINVHGINFVTKTKFESQMKQIVEHIKPLDGPMIIGGDFNIWNKKREIILQESLISKGFKEIEFKNDTRRRKLDRIFVRGIKIESANIIKEIYSSDHKPLELRIRI